ncbi:MAG: pilus assembly protein PilM, partial [Candidatus Omnitrophica bacterium]|nr:pilus assembly protein PilM [Candidatus Omnitrophota bacterium]
MPGPRKLGIFWSENSFTLVETQGSLPVGAVLVPLGDAVKRPDSPLGSDGSEDLRTVAVLQKTLRDRKIDVPKVYLSLPSKDVILRSFTVPLVKPEELGGLVEFEAKKYVPFNLKELVFVYHSTPLVENKIKKLRVIFCAARKDVLDRYERICAQANLVVVGADPAAMGLAKVLVSRNHMRTDQRACVLHVDGRLGRMMFFDRGVIQFMREFPLFAAGGEGEPDAEVVKSRLLNEARNSMDYYDRQISHDKINEIIVLGPPQAGELAQFVGHDLGIPVKHLPGSLNIAHFQACQVEGLYALGACVSNVLPVMSVFNFIRKKSAASFKTAVFGLS